MALDNRRSLVELKRRHRQITHKAKDLAPSKQGEAEFPHETSRIAVSPIPSAEDQ